MTGLVGVLLWHQEERAEDEDENEGFSHTLLLGADETGYGAGQSYSRICFRSTETEIRRRMPVAARILLRKPRRHYHETEMIVLCFGNRAIPEDAVAVELGESLDLPGVTFIPSSSPEEMIDYLDDDLYVMDVAQGIREVTLITDPERFVPPPRVTAHDLDPAVFLKLVQRLYGVSVPVIALPMGIDRQIIREQLLRLLTALPDRVRSRRDGDSVT